MTKPLDPTLVCRGWWGIIDLNRSILNLLMSDINHPKKSMEVIQHSNPETGEGWGVRCCPNATSSARIDSVPDYLSTRMLLNPATGRAKVCIPAQRLLRTERHSTGWRLGGAGYPLLPNGEIPFLHLCSGTWLKDQERLDWVVGDGYWWDTLTFTTFSDHMYRPHVGILSSSPWKLIQPGLQYCIALVLIVCTSYDDKSIGYLEDNLFLLF